MSENKTPIRRINGHALVDEQARSDIEELKVGGGTGGITQETDPTVPSWAKQPNKPTYTAVEVGALPSTTVIPTVPTVLPNPQPIVINGVSYDGSEKKEITIQAADGGIATETDPTVPAWAKNPTKPTYTADEVGALPANASPEDIGAQPAGNYLTAESDPTVPSWAKSANKPKYTASEVGALPDTYEAPVKSVNGKTGAVTLSASDVGALPNTTVIPTVPTALKNPYPITINGVEYDGSEAKTITIQAADGGESVSLDTTLTQYGMAADAGATGNAIAQETAAREQAVNELNEANVKQDTRLTALENASGIVTVEPADDDIPKLYFTGTTPTSKSEGDLQLFLRYISRTAKIEKYVTLKVQGDSSANYPKKNFTMKTYADSAYEEKEKLTFKNWPAMNKFVLKAHWVDHSHVRNVGTAKIWGKIVASRSDYESLPEELRTAANNGATDGFTCKVFVNGVYQGLYELIVPKDKLFGQDSDIVTHSIMNSEQNNNTTCAFSTTAPTISGNWSEELQDSMSSDISTSFTNFIKFVAGSTDDEFVANAETYFDVQSVIDFDIFARVFCIVDNICKNQIFFTYDGVKWYEGAWDMDGILGAPPTVRGFFAYDTAFQTGYIPYIDHGITNLLYERVETLFTDRFKSRYAELRANVLTADNIIDVYERLTDVITTYDGLLEEDFASTTGGGAFTGIPYQTENNIQQLRNFVAARLPYMDEQVEAITPPAEAIPCTGITLDQTELTFTAAGSQTIIATVSPSDTTDTVVWSTSADTVAIVSGGVVTAVGNGSATITATCGEYSATCAVGVSGLENEESVNVMDGVTWSVGTVNANTGEAMPNATSDILSEYFDISNYVGRTMVFNVVGGLGAEGQKIVFYDSNETFIGGFYTSGCRMRFDVPSNAVKARAGMRIDGISFEIKAVDSGGVNIIGEATEEYQKVYNVANGTLVADSGASSRKVAVIGGTKYAVVAVISGAWFNADNEFIEGLAYNANYEYITAPDNAAYFGGNYTNNNTNEVFMVAGALLSVIGYSEPGEIT